MKEIFVIININYNKIIVYNDEGYKIFEVKIKNGKYVDYGIIYSKYIKDMILYKGYFSFGNYIYLYKSINNQSMNENEKENKILKVILLSSKATDGKTCPLLRLVDNTFTENHLATIGLDYDYIHMNLITKNIKYKYGILQDK